ncbi:MAG TPA: helicase-related protein, partial [Azospirillum sp.]
LLGWLSRTGRADGGDVRLVQGRAGAAAEVEILDSRARLPWAGHTAAHALAEVYERIRRHRTTLLFVNTRAQAEILFQALWRANEDHLPIALHHGSLAVEQRRKVEAAMARGDLRAVVATSSLDLGIDWAAVELVVQIGAPKGASRLVQRIGRANHRLDEPSRALLVPANRFEVLECRAAVDAVRAHALDGEPPRPGGLDVLAQHVLGMACAAPFDPADLYDEVVTAAPYAGLPRDEFDDVVDFVATGGYALGNYDRFRRLVAGEDGLMRAADARVARQYRLNVGTIVQEAMLRVRLNRGPVLGEVEEYFVQGLTAGDTFVFAGQVLKFLGIHEMEARVAKGGAGEPKVPAYAGGRLPLTTQLAERVRAILADPRGWSGLPEDVREWLRLQRWRSVLPAKDGLLVETFPHRGKRFLVAYAFEGRNAHQTLGMLLTRRMERMGAGPLGFVATDYVLAVWSLRTPQDMDALFDQDMLGDDLEAWMEESAMLRRTFRNVALITGVIDRRHPGQEKTGRQVTFSSDLIYDVLRRHDPGHVLLRATKADAAGGLTDVRRLSDFLARVRGRITHKDLERISPLAVPVILEIGRESVHGSATDELLEQAAAELVAEAMPELGGGGEAQGRLSL